MDDPRSKLEEQLQDALQADPRTRDCVIDIAIEGRVAHLKGKVPSEEARRAAGEVAKNQPGVAEVINDLHVDADDEVETGLPAIFAGDEDETGVNASLP